MNSPLTASGSTPNTTVVFPPDRSGIGTLAVFAPYPVGYKLLPKGVLGVNINMVYSDRDGLLIYILAYQYMAVGDWIKVYLATKNKPVVEFPITEAHFESNGDAKNIPCHIPAADMESIFAPLLAETKDMWVEVRRISDNSTEDSPHAPLRYKYPAPAEPDTDGGKPFNQGLKLPVASETIIDQTVINDGMFVTVLAYFNQQIGDIVVLAFGSLLLEIEVTALGDVVFELTPEMLATLKPTTIIIVRWGVFDVVENSSGWSDALEIVFKPGIVLLVAPIFEQADIDNVVRHDWLAGGPLWILITGVFAIGDVVVLLLEGFTEGGDPVSHSYSIPVSAATRSLRQDFENFRVQNLIRGSCRATYTLTRAGKTQDSKPTDITIAGGLFKLGLPTVTPLENNDTVPVDTLKCRVQIAKYWPLKPGALVQVLWQAVDDAGIPVLFIFQQVVTDETSIIVFEILAEYIGKYPSSSLVVQCAIINPNEVRVVSEPLQLNIGGEKAIVLDRPTQVPKGTIDPLNGDWLMRIEYLAAQEGQSGQLRMENAAPGTPAFQRSSFNKNKQINWPLERAFLVRHQGGSVNMFWVLFNDAGRLGKSASTTVEIAPILEKDLSEAEISEARGPVIDLSLFPGNATFKLFPWDWAAVWQTVTVVILTNTDTPLPLLEDHPVTEKIIKEGLVAPINRNFLQNNLNKEIIVKIIVREKEPKSKPVLWPEKRYTISQTSFTIQENFDFTPKIYFLTNIPYTLPSGIIIENLAGITFITDSHRLPGQYHTQLLGLQTLNMLGSVRFTFPRLARSVTFLIDSHELSEPGVVIYRNTAGVIIARSDLPYTGLFQHAIISYTSDNFDIKTLEFTNTNNMFVDILTLS